MFYAKSPADLPSKDEMLSMSGLQFMRDVLDGKISAPPIAQLLNFHLKTVEKGAVAFQGTPQFSAANPMGTLHGGWYATVLDSAMACSVMTMVPKGFFYTTAEFKVNITGSLRFGTKVIIQGQVDHMGRSTGVAKAEIRSADDNRLYAIGSTTCLIMKA